MLLQHWVHNPILKPCRTRPDLTQNLIVVETRMRNPQISSAKQNRVLVAQKKTTESSRLGGKSSSGWSSLS